MAFKMNELTARIDTGNIRATKFASPIYSVICDEDLQNGMIGAIGTQVVGENEIYNFIDSTDDVSWCIVSDVVEGTNTEMEYVDESGLTAYDRYYIKAGDTTSVAQLVNGDRVQITNVGIDAIGATPVIGNYLVLEAGSKKLKEVSTLPTTKQYAIIEKPFETIVSDDTILVIGGNTYPDYSIGKEKISFRYISKL